MQIEKAIQMSRPFRSEGHRALVNLLFTSYRLNEYIRGLLKPRGLSPQQYNVLRILLGAGKPISTCVIRKRLLDRMADTSRIVDRLERKGLVVKEVCIQDKRLVDVSLSPQGRQLLESLEEQNASIDGLLDGLPEKDLQELNRLLDQVRNHLSP